MADINPLPRLLTLEQLTAALETSERHVRRLVAERRIPYLKVGGRLRFDADEIAGWLDAARRSCRRDRAVVRELRPGPPLRSGHGSTGQSPPVGSAGNG
ncbi:MAG: helix-turn-helix domain-containing protein [Acidimicrobiales bacterium]